MSLRKHFLVLLLLISGGILYAQTGIVKGYVRDKEGNAIQGALVIAAHETHYVLTDTAGFYLLKIKAQDKIFLSFNHISFAPFAQQIDLKAGQTITVDVQLKEMYFESDTVFVSEKKTPRAENQVEIDQEILDDFVSPSDDALAAVKSLASVSSNNELSSAYNVRGGNFDENLIYVNGIEIFRPFLIRSGQQEGLSFVNSDLVKSLKFSAGGFDAIYGDKMSSVLDIEYREAKKTAASVNLSLLGARASVEGLIKEKFSFIMGARYKTNSYLLGTLDTQGEYQPQFFDYQTYFTYRPNEKIKIGILGNLGANRYQFVPQSRSTTFGGINEAYQLFVAMDGNEVNQFNTYFGALSFDYQVSLKTLLKFSVSGFSTNEQETFDVEGAYELGELETSLASDQFGEVSQVVGNGSFLEHARNYLFANIYGANHQGIHYWRGGKLLWGINYQQEQFRDGILEWKYVDSADYSVPVSSGAFLNLSEFRQSSNALKTERGAAFLQNNWELLPKSKHQLFLNTGIRVSYWSFAQQTLLSPRASLVFIPGRTSAVADSTSIPQKKGQLSYRVAWGYYYQPPFYREIRDYDGKVVDGIESQKSIHYVAGVDYEFTKWKVPFTWRSEIYYKQYEQLIPFEMENVKLRYYGNNNAKGYAAGIESRINGEFVEGLESWFSFSLMKTEEIIDNYDYTVYYNDEGNRIYSGFTENAVVVDSATFSRGWMPRPTDQRASFKIFFQDKMPKIPSMKVHLNLIYATGLPFGQSQSVEGRNAFRIPDYRRVDIGFSYDIIEKGKLRKGTRLIELSESHFLRFFESLYFRAEVFNLLDINNTVSYYWVSDINKRQYAIPNYLTQRLINIRLAGKF